MDHAVAATCCWSPEPNMYPHIHTHTLPRTGQPQETEGAFTPTSFMEYDHDDANGIGKREKETRREKGHCR